MRAISGVAPAVIDLDRTDRDIVGIKPKPAFRPLFDIVNTRKGSGVTFIENAETDADSASACLEWRWGESTSTANTEWK